jgi:uncharacterized protein YndB with AHSA1/START domain
MGDYHILQQFDIDADRATVRSALSGAEAIGSWWSNRTEQTDGTDPQLRVSFPDVPQPFEFSIRDGGPDRIEWVTGGFPPWWAGTTIRWDLMDRDDGKPGTRLFFSHRGYEPDNPVIPIVTPAWAQIILRLKGYAETGERQPFFDF